MSVDVRQAGIALKACVQMIYRVYPGGPCPRCDGRLTRYSRAWTLFTGPSFLKCQDCKFIAWKSRPAPIAIKLAHTRAKKLATGGLPSPLLKTLDTLRSSLAVAMVVIMVGATSVWLVSGKDVLKATEMSASAALPAHTAFAVSEEWRTRSAPPQMLATVDVQPFVLTPGEPALLATPDAVPDFAPARDVPDVPSRSLRRAGGPSSLHHRRLRVASKHR